MRRSHAFALVILLAVTAVGLAGCSSWFESPAKPANDAITSANTHLKKAADLETQIESDTSSLDALPYTKDGAVQGLAITAKLRTSLATEKSELEAAEKALAGVAKLEVDKAYKQYAKLEAAGIETRITMTDTTSRLFDAMDKLYGGLKSTTGTTIEPQDFQAVVAQIKQELTDLSTQATKQAQAASDYFTANKLGQ